MTTLATGTRRRTTPATRPEPASTDRRQHPDALFADSRRELLCYLMKLNRALDKNLTDLSETLMIRFCDTLVDYLSAGHFRAFPQLVVPTSAYRALDTSTRAGMLFADRFGHACRVQMHEMKAALDQVAHVLSARLELEDELLRVSDR